MTCTPITVKSTRADDGQWRITIDGRPTRILIDKEAPPKFGMPQTWAIGIEDAEGYPDWVAFGIYGKGQAIAAVHAILEAAQAS